MKNMWTKIHNFLNSYFENECEEDIVTKSFFEGMKYYDNKEYEKALEFYKIALKYKPNSDTIYNNIGNAYLAQKNYDQALIHYKQALNLNRKSLNVHTNIGLLYHNQENYKEALSWYLESEKIDPVNELFYIDIASCYNKIKEYNRAIDYYLKAFQINDKDIDILSNLSVCYFRVKEFEKSIEFSSKLLEEDSDNYSPYVNIFEAELMLNRPFTKNLEEEFIKKFSDNKEELILYSHLKILEDIMLEKGVDLEEWEATYEGISFHGWEFEALDFWAETYEDIEIRAKLLDALDCFKRKK